MSYPQYLLAIGDGGSPDESMDLRDLQRGIMFTEHSIAFDGHQLTGTLFVSGADEQWLWSWFDRIEHILTHASRATGPTGHGSRVTVTVLRGTGAIHYIDVQGGTIRPATIFPSGVEMLCDVTLDCLPLIRDEPYSVAVSTFVNGTGGIYLEAVPGTAPALLGFDLTDVSTGSVILQQMMIGVWGERDLASTGFSGVIDCTPASGGGGGEESGASGFIGGGAETVVTNETVRQVGDIIIPQRGQFEVWARIKDPATANNSDPLREFSLSTTATGGTLGLGPWSYVLAVLDTSDDVIAVSPLKTITAITGTTNANHLAWPAVTGAAKYRPYYKHDSADWSYMPTTTLTTYAHTTETGATVGDPPTAPSPSVANTLFRLATRLPGGEAVWEYDWTPSRLANNQYEALLLADGVFPPKPRSEGETDTTSYNAIEATSGGTNSETVACDGAWLMPKGKCTATYRGLALATQRRWVLTPDREGVMAGVLLDAATGAGAGSLMVTGCPQAWPGSNTVVLMLLAQGGVSDVTDATVEGSVIVYPRRRWPGGSPWSS